MRGTQARDGFSGELAVSYAAAATPFRRAAERSSTSELERSNERLQATVADAVAAQHRFSDLVNSVEGIVWEADATTFQFSFVSNQAERILGYPVERWLSEPTFWKDHLHPEDPAWAVALWEKATGEARDDFEYRMIATDGRVVWLRERVTVVLDGDRPARLRGVMIDITERKRAEQERQAPRWFVESMDQVNRAIQGTNDLEQMMNASLNWLAAADPDLELLRDALDAVVKDSHRAADVIQRIRQLTTKTEPQKARLDINDLIRDVVPPVRSEMRRHHVSLRVDLAPTSPWVLGDRVQLQTMNAEGAAGFSLLFAKSRQEAGRWDNPGASQEAGDTPLSNMQRE